ncbi:TIGR04282 family arsenosugar biosynthesis glycosyltransferase [Winogradskyella sp. A3E31]|uniref:TIGR04282 family arsenosugar biosynthesis glycosyltransferase n=1 Tax=Winogradskyella sp. A3E31 TaxID=3349637 RepID=UPI00398ABC57
MKNKHQDLIIVFTRNPELGKVKTRLAKGIGDVAALDVYKKLLTHTEETILPINADKAIYYSVKVRDNDIWNNEAYLKYQQTGEDLGIRMLNAFKSAFKSGYKKVIIVGSDLYDLRATHLEKAFSALDQNDYVIGPAKDGGYYLLGMTQLTGSVFKDKDWGTSTVCQNTLNDLEGNKVHILETLNDIDFAEDLKPYEDFKYVFK